MKEAVEDGLLILLRDSDAEVLNLEEEPLAFLFQKDPNPTLIRSVLDGILEKTLHNILENSLGHQHAKILGPFELEMDVAMAGPLLYLLQGLLRKRKARKWVGSSSSSEERTPSNSW